MIKLWIRLRNCHVQDLLVNYDARPPSVIVFFLLDNRQASRSGSTVDSEDFCLETSLSLDDL